MANVTTLAIGGTTNTSYGQTGLEVIKHEIDIKEAVDAGLATTEYVVALNIPANTHLYVYQANVVNALSLGAGARIDIGDSGSATRFVNNATTLTAGTNLTLAAGQFFYGTANTVRITVTGGTIASGKIRLVFGLVNCQRVEATGSPGL
jgi:hypothetical protein